MRVQDILAGKEKHPSPGESGTGSVQESLSITDHKNNFVEMFEKFLPIAMEYIGLSRLPKIKFTGQVGDADQPTFGRYANGKHVLEVALMNRHPNDILRTIAHELTHYKQDTEHQLEPDSGRTGSPVENEANAVAGIVMRHFNKQYPEYLSSKPITEDLEENFADGKHPERKGDSQRRGIPKNASMTQLKKAAHARGRKGQLARWQIKMRNGKK